MYSSISIVPEFHLYLLFLYIIYFLPSNTSYIYILNIVTYIVYILKRCRIHLYYKIDMRLHGYVLRDLTITHIDICDLHYH